MLKKLTVLMIPAAVIFALLIYVETQTNAISNFMAADRRVMQPTGVSISYSTNSKPVFALDSNGFLCVTKDGATYYNTKGALVWSQTFTMNEPYIAKSGNKFAILEPLGTKVYVCDSTGVLYETSSDFPILSAGISASAGTMLIQKANDLYLMPLYDSTGSSPLTHKSELENVFPVSVDVSDDGYVYVISWIDTAYSSLLSRVLYSYTDSGAQRFSQSAQMPFKAIERADTIISSTRFFADGNLLLAGDDAFIITTRNGEEITTITPQNRILLTDFSDTMFCYVTGEALPNAEEPQLPHLVQWFSSDGAKMGEFSAGIIEYVSIDGDMILIKDDMFYYCVDKTGKLLWQVGSAQDIITVLPLGQKRALVAKGESAEINELKRSSNGE